METLYLVEAYGGVYYESDWHENIGVYSTLEKAIEAGNIYMRSIIEETKRDPRFANQEMTYEEITLANWKNTIVTNMTVNLIIVKSKLFNDN